MDIFYVIADCNFRPTSWECEIAALAIIWATLRRAVDLRCPCADKRLKLVGRSHGSISAMHQCRTISLGNG